MIGLKSWSAAGDSLPEEGQWLEGGRYEVLLPTALRCRPDLVSTEVGYVYPRDGVLLLALQVVQIADGTETLLAYLANTKRPDWICGWGQIEGPPREENERALRRRRLRGSWQVGGRYRVLGSPVLRTSIELESEKLYDINNQEEVLILDIGLVLRSREPRLRAHVRTDAGHLGWLTVELPGGQPLLEPLNLYSEEAAASRGGLLPSLWSKKKPVRNRMTPSGEVTEEAWEVGGKYRTLARAQLQDGAEFESKIVGIAKKGSIVFVVDIRHMQRPQGDSQVRLQVVIGGEDGAGDPSSPFKLKDTTVIMWLTPVSAAGELIVDVRDHLEYEKLLIASGAMPANGGATTALPPESEVREFSVVIDRTYADALGLEVDHQDGSTLVIDAIGEGPFNDYNLMNPAELVFPNDRIICVNNQSGNALALVEELSQKQVLHMVLQRITHRGWGPDFSAPLAEEDPTHMEEEVLGQPWPNAEGDWALQQPSSSPAIGSDSHIRSDNPFTSWGTQGGGPGSDEIYHSRDNHIRTASFGHDEPSGAECVGGITLDDGAAFGPPPMTTYNVYEDDAQIEVDLDFDRQGTVLPGVDATLMLGSPGSPSWMSQIQQIGEDASLRPAETLWSPLGEPVAMGEPFASQVAGAGNPPQSPVVYGVARPFFGGIEDGPETRPFRDAALEGECPVATSCPCRNDGPLGFLNLNLNCGGTGSAAAGYFHKFLATTVGTDGQGIDSTKSSSVLWDPDQKMGKSASKGMNSDPHNFAATGDAGGDGSTGSSVGRPNSVRR